jgi:hypothetical protein
MYTNVIQEYNNVVGQRIEQEKLDQDIVQWWAFVIMVMNLLVQIKHGRIY